MSIQGAASKLDNPSPGGCHVKPEVGAEKFRLWFYRTQAAAFEMLDTFQAGLRAIDTVVKELPSPEAARVSSDRNGPPPCESGATAALGGHPRERAAVLRAA